MRCCRDSAAAAGGRGEADMWGPVLEEVASCLEFRDFLSLQRLLLRLSEEGREQLLLPLLPLLCQESQLYKQRCRQPPALRTLLSSSHFFHPQDVKWVLELLNLPLRSLAGATAAGSRQSAATAAAGRDSGAAAAGVKRSASASAGSKDATAAGNAAAAAGRKGREAAATAAAGAAKRGVRAPTSKATRSDAATAAPPARRFRAPTTPAAGAAPSAPASVAGGTSLKAREQNASGAVPAATGTAALQSERDIITGRSSAVSGRPGSSSSSGSSSNFDSGSSSERTRAGCDEDRYGRLSLPRVRLDARAERENAPSASATAESKGFVLKTEQQQSPRQPSQRQLSQQPQQQVNAEAQKQVGGRPVQQELPQHVQEQPGKQLLRSAVGQQQQQQAGKQQRQDGRTVAEPSARAAVYVQQHGLRGGLSSSSSGRSVSETSRSNTGLKTCSSNREGSAACAPETARKLLLLPSHLTAEEVARRFCVDVSMYFYSQAQNAESSSRNVSSTRGESGQCKVLADESSGSADLSSGSGGVERSRERGSTEEKELDWSPLLCVLAPIFLRVITPATAARTACKQLRRQQRLLKAGGAAAAAAAPAADTLQLVGGHTSRQQTAAKAPAAPLELKSEADSQQATAAASALDASAAAGPAAKQQQRIQQQRIQQQPQSAQRDEEEKQEQQQEQREERQRRGPRGDGDAAGETAGLLARAAAGKEMLLQVPAALPNKGKQARSRGGACVDLSTVACRTQSHQLPSVRAYAPDDAPGGSATAVAAAALSSYRLSGGDAAAAVSGLGDARQRHPTSVAASAAAHAAADFVAADAATPALPPFESPTFAAAAGSALPPVLAFCLEVLRAECRRRRSASVCAQQQQRQQQLRQQVLHRQQEQRRQCQGLPQGQLLQPPGHRPKEVGQLLQVPGHGQGQQQLQRQLQRQLLQQQRVSAAREAAEHAVRIAAAVADENDKAALCVQQNVLAIVLAVGSISQGLQVADLLLGGVMRWLCHVLLDRSSPSATSFSAASVAAGGSSYLSPSFGGSSFSSPLAAAAASECASPSRAPAAELSVNSSCLLFPPLPAVGGEETSSSLTFVRLVFLSLQRLGKPYADFLSLRLRSHALLKVRRLAQLRESLSSSSLFCGMWTASPACNARKSSSSNTGADALEPSAASAAPAAVGEKAVAETVLLLQPLLRLLLFPSVEELHEACCAGVFSLQTLANSKLLSAGAFAKYLLPLREATDSCTAAFLKAKLLLLFYVLFYDPQEQQRRRLLSESHARTRREQLRQQQQQRLQQQQQRQQQEHLQQQQLQQQRTQGQQRVQDPHQQNFQQQDQLRQEDWEDEGRRQEGGKSHALVAGKRRSRPASSGTLLPPSSSSENASSRIASLSPPGRRVAAAGAVVAAGKVGGGSRRVAAVLPLERGRAAAYGGDSERAFVAAALHRLLQQALDAGEEQETCFPRKRHAAAGELRRATHVLQQQVKQHHVIQLQQQQQRLVLQQQPHQRLVLQQQQEQRLVLQQQHLPSQWQPQLQAQTRSLRQQFSAQQQQLTVKVSPSAASLKFSSSAGGRGTASWKCQLTSAPPQSQRLATAVALTGSCSRVWGLAAVAEMVGLLPLTALSPPLRRGLRSSLASAVAWGIRFSSLTSGAAASSSSSFDPAHATSSTAATAGGEANSGAGGVVSASAAAGGNPSLLPLAAVCEQLLVAGRHPLAAATGAASDFAAPAAAADRPWRMTLTAAAAFPAAASLRESGLSFAAPSAAVAAVQLSPGEQLRQKLMLLLVEAEKEELLSRPADPLVIERLLLEQLPAAAARMEWFSVKAANTLLFHLVLGSLLGAAAEAAAELEDAPTPTAEAAAAARRRLQERRRCRAVPKSAVFVQQPHQRFFLSKKEAEDAAAAAMAAQQRRHAERVKRVKETARTKLQLLVKRMLGGATGSCCNTRYSSKGSSGARRRIAAGKLRLRRAVLRQPRGGAKCSGALLRQELRRRQVQRLKRKRIQQHEECGEQQRVERQQGFQKQQLYTTAPGAREESSDWVAALSDCKRKKSRLTCAAAELQQAAAGGEAAASGDPAAARAGALPAVPSRSTAAAEASAAAPAQSAAATGRAPAAAIAGGGAGAEPAGAGAGERLTATAGAVEGEGGAIAARAEGGSATGGPAERERGAIAAGAEGGSATGGPAEREGGAAAAGAGRGTATAGPAQGAGGAAAAGAGRGTAAVAAKRSGGVAAIAGGVQKVRKKVRFADVEIKKKNKKEKQQVVEEKSGPLHYASNRLYYFLLTFAAHAVDAAAVYSPQEVLKRQAKVGGGASNVLPYVGLQRWLQCVEVLSEILQERQLQLPVAAMQAAAQETFLSAWVAPLVHQRDSQQESSEDHEQLPQAAAAELGATPAGPEGGESRTGTSAAARPAEAARVDEAAEEPQDANALLSPLDVPVVLDSLRRHSFEPPAELSQTSLLLGGCAPAGNGLLSAAAVNWDSAATPTAAALSSRRASWCAALLLYLIARLHAVPYFKAQDSRYVTRLHSLPWNSALNFCGSEPLLSHWFLRFLQEALTNALPEILAVARPLPPDWQQQLDPSWHSPLLLQHAASCSRPEDLKLLRWLEELSEAAGAGSGSMWGTLRSRSYYAAAAAATARAAFACQCCCRCCCTSASSSSASSGHVYCCRARRRSHSSTAVDRLGSSRQRHCCCCGNSKERRIRIAERAAAAIATSGRGPWTKPNSPPTAQEIILFGLQHLPRFWADLLEPTCETRAAATGGGVGEATGGGDAADSPACLVGSCGNSSSSGVCGCCAAAARRPASFASSAELLLTLEQWHFFCAVEPILSSTCLIIQLTAAFLPSSAEQATQWQRQQSPLQQPQDEEPKKQPLNIQELSCRRCARVTSSSSSVSATRGAVFAISALAASSPSFFSSAASFPAAAFLCSVVPDGLWDAGSATHVALHYFNACQNPLNLLLRLPATVLRRLLHFDLLPDCVHLLLLKMESYTCMGAPILHGFPPVLFSPEDVYALQEAAIFNVLIEACRAPLLQPAPPPPSSVWPFSSPAAPAAAPAAAASSSCSAAGTPQQQQEAEEEQQQEREASDGCSAGTWEQLCRLLDRQAARRPHALHLLFSTGFALEAVLPVCRYLREGQRLLPLLTSLLHEEVAVLWEENPPPEASGGPAGERPTSTDATAAAANPPAAAAAGQSQPTEQPAAASDSGLPDATTAGVHVTTGLSASVHPALQAYSRVDRCIFFLKCIVCIACDLRDNQPLRNAPQDTNPAAAAESANRALLEAMKRVNRTASEALCQFVIRGVEVIFPLYFLFPKLAVLVITFLSRRKMLLTAEEEACFFVHGRPSAAAEDAAAAAGEGRGGGETPAAQQQQQGGSRQASTGSQEARRSCEVALEQLEADLRRVVERDLTQQEAAAGEAAESHATFLGDDV